MFVITSAIKLKIMMIMSHIFCLEAETHKGKSIGDNSGVLRKEGTR